MLLGNRLCAGGDIYQIRDQVFDIHRHTAIEQNDKDRLIHVHRASGRM